MDRSVRVLLDVNIFVANIMAYDRGHTGTATQSLVSMVSAQTWGMTRKSQLIISFEMIDTLEAVLRRMHFSEDRIKAYSGSIIDIMRSGPEQLDPYLILGGEERFAMPDIEDAGVLATAFAADADLLVTDNLSDFTTKDSVVINTQRLNTKASGPRILQALRYQVGGGDLVVAHPFDVMQWLRLGYDFKPDALWQILKDSTR
ncbi:PIN domain-containing protein [Rhizobium sp. C4]|uniref:PIN domain-containing protein n=1 Tax=Rhizobium sp. C4 TaxID=1349800 RepID=UPI001E3F70F1|nr:PIN domain-containing protein [Rhizobium sp. C4]MCD2173828.1 PIN domain-containing protein [Rhizobium sp. C4]